MKVKRLMGLMLVIILISIEVFPQEKKLSKTDYLITIGTRFGKIYVVLFDETPRHKENFLKLTEQRFFDGTTFHFVLNDFMVMGGDQNTKPGGDTTKIGLGSPGYTLEPEIVDSLAHQRGSLGAARQKDEINEAKRSSGSHFYIIQNHSGAAHLDGQYTVFGQVIKGMEIVDKIAKTEIDERAKPLENITMTVRAVLMKKKKITKLFGYKFEEK